MYQDVFISQETGFDSFSNSFIMDVSLARPQQIDEHTEVGINHGYL